LIADEAERLTNIVEQVLRFANAKAGRPIGGREAVKVDSLVDGALSATSRELDRSRCVAEKQIDPDLPPVFADAVSVKHALQNVLSNAAKYGGEGGWVGVHASKAEDDDQIVEIRVADRGPGIPADELGQIFDPFYRGRRALEDQVHGTGLGLSLVKRIVEAHGGTVSVKSEPGKGTEFVLRIPAAQAELVDEFADTSH
jgi:signal transduction histidine kinase